VQSVLITANVVNSNPAPSRCILYNIMFVSDLRQVGNNNTGFKTSNEKQTSKPTHGSNRTLQILDIGAGYQGSTRRATQLIPRWRRYILRIHLDGAGFEFTTLAVISTDCTGTLNYHTITTMVAAYDSHKNVVGLNPLERIFLRHLGMCKHK
jgi:hypothetical protein